MEVTGKGGTKGFEGAPSQPTFNGPRQEWAKSASKRLGHVSEGHYNGEINLVRDWMSNNELAINPDQFCRAGSTWDGSIKYGKFPV